MHSWLATCSSANGSFPKISSVTSTGSDQDAILDSILSDQLPGNREHDLRIKNKLHEAKRFRCQGNVSFEKYGYAAVLDNFLAIYLKKIFIYQKFYTILWQKV